MDVWPQSLTNGVLALRKSGTYWIIHTPVLSSTDWYTKKEIFVVVWVYFDWDEWIFAVVSNQWIFGLV